MKTYKKPPLGLYSHHLWIYDRIHEILGAMERYIQAYKQIPINWVEEYNELIAEVQNERDFGKQRNKE